MVAPPPGAAPGVGPMVPPPAAGGPQAKAPTDKPADVIQTTQFQAPPTTAGLAGGQLPPPPPMPSGMKSR
jgi:hypothetical protein